MDQAAGKDVDQAFEEEVDQAAGQDVDQVVEEDVNQAACGRMWIRQHWRRWIRQQGRMVPVLTHMFLLIRYFTILQIRKKWYKNVGF